MYVDASALSELMELITADANAAFAGFKLFSAALAAAVFLLGGVAGERGSGGGGACGEIIDHNNHLIVALKLFSIQS